MYKATKYLILLLVIYLGYLFLNTKQIEIDHIYVINLDRKPDRLIHMKEQLKDLSYSRFSAFDGAQVELINKQTGEVIKGSELTDYNKHIQGEFDIICSKEWAGDFKPLKLDMNRFSKRFMGELGCLCSHKRVWQDITQKGYKNALIFEDDIFLNSYFKQYLSLVLKFVPKDSQMLYLAITGGGFTYKQLDKLSYMNENIINKIIYRISDFYKQFFKNIFFKQVIRQPGTASAYVLSIEAAKAILHQKEAPFVTNGILPNNYVADGILDDAVTNKVIKSYVVKPLIARQRFNQIASTINQEK